MSDPRITLLLTETEAQALQVAAMAGGGWYRDAIAGNQGLSSQAKASQVAALERALQKLRIA